jgi:hypothetical protein
MTERFQCGDGATLVAYLYGECTPAEREATAAHAAACPRCAAELEGLGLARRRLDAWRPPEARLGFQVTAADADTVVDARAAFGARGNGLRGMETPAPAPGWWRRPLPAWGQAAAALLVFAAGLGVGWSRAVPEIGAAPVAVDASAGALRQELQALEARVDGVERGSKSVQAAADAELTRRIEAAFRQWVPSERQWVKAQIADSENRQRQELAVRTIQVLADFEEKRKSDTERWTRVSQETQDLSRALRVNYRGAPR